MREEIEPMDKITVRELIRRLKMIPEEKQGEEFSVTLNGHIDVSLVRMAYLTCPEAFEGELE